MSEAPDRDDPSDIAANEAAAAARMQAQQEAAAADAQSSAAREAATDDASASLADLAASESDPFDDDVLDEDWDNTAVSDVSDADAFDATASDTGAPVTTSDDTAPDASASDTTAGVVDDAPSAETDTDTAVPGDAADAAADDDGITTAQTASKNRMAQDSMTQYRKRLRDEEARRASSTAAASDSDDVRALHERREEARKRGLALGLVDPDLIKAMDDDFEYINTVLEEEQRSAHGPGSAMYEEARRLGYVVAADRTAEVSSMRMRTDADAAREAYQQLRFNNHWQQRAALAHIAAVKAVMIAQQNDDGSSSGFAQLGMLFSEMGLGDGISDDEIDAYIVALDSDDAVEDDVAPVDAHDLGADSAGANTDANDTDADDALAVTDMTAGVRERSVHDERAAAPPQRVAAARRARPRTSAAVSTHNQPASDTSAQREKGTAVEIDEFIGVWEHFGEVERRIVLRRLGLVTADEVDDLYMQLQRTVKTREQECEQLRSDYEQMRADLEYETNSRRDLERELAQVRGQSRADSDAE